ncbi:MAG TPA: C1 family peptidase [bacterium]|nr:C1 family peptidase [bacterium]
MGKYRRIAFLGLLSLSIGACQGSGPQTEGVSIYGAVFPSDEEIAAFPKSIHPQALSTPEPTATPASILLGNTPPIGQQGPCSLCPEQGSPGSCISWSAAYGLGTYTVNQSRNWGVDDPAHQVSAAFMYAWELNAQSKACPEGTSDPGYFNFMVKNGSVANSIVPYEATCSYLDGIDLGTLADPAFRIGSWASVSPQDRDLIKAHLAGGQAVAFAGHLYQGFGQLQGPDVFYGSGPFEVNKNTGQLVGHGMLLIGYDDERGDPSQGLGAYRIQNSFGTTWGDEGYLWMSYGTFESSILTAFVALPLASAVEGVADLLPDSPAAPLGRIKTARQWERKTDGSSRVFLVFEHQFDEPVELGEIEVTDPSGKTARHAYRTWQRDGYTHLSRSDGRSFLSGLYQVRIEAILASGETAIYSGEATVGPLAPALPEAPFGEGLAGGNLGPAEIL